MIQGGSGMKPDMHSMGLGTDPLCWNNQNVAEIPMVNLTPRSQDTGMRATGQALVGLEGGPPSMVRREDK